MYMFSGIVEDLGTVVGREVHAGVRALRVAAGFDDPAMSLGDSIAVSGVCLTVVARSGREMSFELLEETCRRSTLGALQVGDRVNLERSLQVGARVSGHFVFGHVDCRVPLLARERDGSSERLCFALPADLRWALVPKGSVALSGVSLTVGEVLKDAFTVYLIPHTSNATTLGTLGVGQEVNLEIDMLARYARAALGQEGAHG